MTTEVASKMLDSMKVKADEGEEEEEEEEEEDLVDPAAEIKEKCGEGSCSGMKVSWCCVVTWRRCEAADPQAMLDGCNSRVTSKARTTETCFEEILDFYHCVDHCAAPTIFQHVK